MWRGRAKDQQTSEHPHLLMLPPPPHSNNKSVCPHLYITCPYYNTALVKEVLLINLKQDIYTCEKQEVVQYMDHGQG